MEETVEAQLETVGAIIEIAAEFAIAYGLQIIGALVILLIGLKFAGFVGRRITNMCARKELDITLSRFAGNAAKILLVAIVVIITLSNFGIDIAPLVALGGAAALGLSFAIQGPVSNYGAGLVIILTRPFTVGDTILVQDVSGVVEEVSLSSTTLIGEDQELITIPNRKVVGEILVNSAAHRIVESQIVIAADSDPEVAITAIAKALAAYPDMAEGSDPQVGIHDFSYGGIILGLRYWVPSSRYFKTRFEVNRAAYAALKGAGIELMSGGRVAILAEPPAGA
ncbi:MAG: mechanosensitive ion channel [Rhodospirillaceae bacterium]|nr:mechanosensitive ion channel [Rhodospirillaceae bacterium]MBT6405046.1 mechanosensitive ion channel [Rhodospirillaceae bacterium]MBT6535155.1 mechanosensitive ion channel [Rhodospirillaceae bacterium]MBT7361568.1 mechanosensitive ion channel [Rhodospirillaceae bacterium]